MRPTRSGDESAEAGTAPGGHTVVVGDTGFARALVRQQGDRGRAVVHVGRQPVDGDARSGARHVRLGDDPEPALAEASAARAAIVAIDLPTDAETLAALAILVESLAPSDGVEIVANVRDATLRRIVDENLHAMSREPRPRLVSTAALAAAAAVAAMRPHGLAYWRGQERLHAVVIGFSRLGRECFEDLVLAGIVGELGKPRITILAKDPVEVNKLLDRDMPEIAVSADIVVLPFDRLTFAAPDGPLAAAEAEVPVTLFCVTLDEAQDSISTMMSLSRMQEHDGRAIGAVALVSEGRRAMLELISPPGRPRDLGRRWQVFGGIERDPDLIDLVTGRADAMAAQIHEAYRTRFGGVAGSTAPWPELAETFRRSNRRAAAHLPLKLWTLGLQMPGTSADPFGVEPHAHATVVLPCARGTQEDAILRRLSRIEHDRWCAERRLDGWRFDEIRDDRRRLHPKLVPFDDPRFTEADIEKDADQIRNLFEDVVRPDPDGAVAPLVLGIVASADPHPGIDVAAALALSVREPWRPIIVLTAMLDALECRRLRDLDQALAAAGRGFRLLVPELQRDNRDLRVLTEADDLAFLQECLDRPGTRFAPIAGAVAPADLWADPSAPDPHAAAILAYVVARATAVIDR